MATYSVDAILLSRRDLGEADKLLTLYTREKGKLSAVARGARKPGAKLAGLTEALSISRIHLAVGKTFDIITQVQPLRAFSKLRADLDRLSFAMFWCELVDTLVHEGEASEPLYELIESVLSALEKSPHPEAALRWGEFQLMAELGYEPIVNACARCEKVPNGLWAGFSPSVGGVLCARCGVEVRDSVRVPLETVGVIQSLLHSETPPAELPQREPIARLLKAYWRSHLNRDLRSAAFLDELLTANP